MSLISLLTTTNSHSDYYVESFKNTLEAHLPYLRASSKSRLVILTDLQGVVYKGNLYGLLNELRVAKYLHWIVMRINGMYSSFDFNADITTLRIPDTAELEQLRMSWKSSQKVNA